MMQNITNAVEFAASFSTKRYPASPTHICEQLGIIIVSDKHLSADGYLVCHNGKKLIFVNANIQNRHRQNFIISHELGHFLLHQQQLQSCKRISFQATYDVNSQQQEREANAFASELLMPYDELVKCVPNREITFGDISKIADYFDVSMTHAALQTISASITENETLLCYNGNALSWYKTADNRHTLKKIPAKCPIDPASSKASSYIVNIWDMLYTGQVKQEIFHPFGDQYLILLSGHRNE